MEIEEAIKRVDLIVPMLRHDVETAILSHEVMEAQNSIIPSGLGGRHTDFVNTYNAIQNALVLKLAMDIARVFDVSLARPVERQDMASIPVLGMLLKTDGVRAALINRALEWIGGIEWVGDADTTRHPDFEETALELLKDEQLADAATCGAAIDRLIDLTVRLSLPGSPEAAALARVRDFRNRRLAHSLFNKEPDSYPMYSDLSLLLDIAKEAAALASMAVEGLSTDFADQAVRNRADADGFAACVLDGLTRAASR